MYPKETVEAAQGLLALAKELAKVSKDGLQLSDVVAVANAVQQEPLKTKLAMAQEGLDKVKEEIKDINLADGLSMLAVLGPELAELMQEIGKKA